MRVSGREFLALEENLNLMSKSDIHNAGECALQGGGYRFAVKSVKLLGIDSNVLLYGWREHG